MGLEDCSNALLEVNRGVWIFKRKEINSFRVGGGDSIDFNVLLLWISPTEANSRRKLYSINVTASV